MTDPLMGGVHVTGETDIHIDMEKNDVQVRLLSSLIKQARPEAGVEIANLRP